MRFRTEYHHQSYQSQQLAAALVVAALGASRAVVAAAGCSSAEVQIAAALTVVDATAVDEVRTGCSFRRPDLAERRPVDGRPAVAWCPACRRRFQSCSA